jgi:outer membrane protein assembly factor BamD
MRPLVTAALVAGLLLGAGAPSARAAAGPGPEPGGTEAAGPGAAPAAGATPARRVREPESPQQLYEAGLRQMRRGYYDEAIISFEKVKNQFPFNQYSVLAELRVADCLYEKAAFLEAAEAYRQFSKLHPRHAEADYVAFRIAKSEIRLAPVVPQKDQDHTTRGLERLRDFEARWPASQYLAEVQKLRRQAETRLARRDAQIGNFYWKGRHWNAAERRYRLAADAYPGTATAARARYRQALCLLRLERREEALAVMRRLAESPPVTRWSRRARGYVDGAGADAGGGAGTGASREAPPLAPAHHGE